MEQRQQQQHLPPQEPGQQALQGRQPQSLAPQPSQAPPPENQPASQERLPPYQRPQQSQGEHRHTERHHSPQGHLPERERPQQDEEETRRPPSDHSQRNSPPVGAPGFTRQRPSRRFSQFRRGPTLVWGTPSIAGHLRLRALARRLFEQRMNRFNDMVRYFNLLVDPEALEEQRLVHQMALGLLLLTRDILESFQNLQVIRQNERFGFDEAAEHSMINQLVDKLNRIERQFAARRRQERSEQPSVSPRSPPISPNCCTQQQQQQQQQQQASQQHNDRQNFQEPPGDSTICEQLIRQYQDTLQQLQTLHLTHPEDLSGQAVYLHVALAQLHVLEHGLSRSPHGSHPALSLRRLRVLKAEVIMQIYHLQFH